MKRCKAIWSVTAEIIPGQIIPELSRGWAYTDHDYLQDKEKPKDQPTIFSTYVQESADYAMSLQDPSSVNIVKLQFMWM